MLHCSYGVAADGLYVEGTSHKIIFKKKPKNNRCPETICCQRINVLLNAVLDFDRTERYTLHSDFILSHQNDNAYVLTTYIYISNICINVFINYIKKKTTHLVLNCKLPD